MKIQVEIDPQDIEKIAELVAKKMTDLLPIAGQSAATQTRFIPIKKWADHHP